MERKYLEFKTRVQEWASEEHREDGAIPEVIIIGAGVAIALALVALMWALFNSHSEPLQ